MGREDETLALHEGKALLRGDGRGDELEAGAIVGDYILGDLIAKGGCGAVYHAKHRVHARHVALKLLHATLAAQPKMVERFVREVKMANLLQHPNIIEVDEVGVLPSGRPFFAMEYLKGRTLDEQLRAEGRILPEEALELLEPVCSALEAAHAAGIIHRDVKASNILVVRAEPRTIKLLDFGIAKLARPDADFPELTSIGRQVGTPTIMAPEQLLGCPIDERVDVYALGILLYRLLTGKLPFAARNPGELARQHIEEPAPRPSQRLPIAPALDAIVLCCMEKDPDRRFDSAKSFIEALREALQRPTSERVSQPPIPAMGVAIYLELQMRTDDDDLDDALSLDLRSILDITEERLKGEGFLLPLMTGSEILGVRLLPDDPAEIRRTQEEAITVAAQLREEVDRRPTADDRIHASISLHVDEILVSSSDRLSIVGGALIRAAARGTRATVPSAAPAVQEQA